MYMIEKFEIENNVLKMYRGIDKVVSIPAGVIGIGREAFQDNKSIECNVNQLFY